MVAVGELDEVEEAVGPVGDLLVDQGLNQGAQQVEDLVSTAGNQQRVEARIDGDKELVERLGADVVGPACGSCHGLAHESALDSSHGAGVERERIRLHTGLRLHLLDHHALVLGVRPNARTPENRDLNDERLVGALGQHAKNGAEQRTVKCGSGAVTNAETTGELGQERFHTAVGRGLIEHRGNQGIGDHGLHHVDCEQALMTVLLDVGNAGHGAAVEVGVIDGAKRMALERKRGTHIRGALLALPTERREADVARIGHGGAGLDVEEGVARLGGDAGDVVGVHMAGEHRRDAGIGVTALALLVIVDQILAHERRLHGEVWDHTVVLGHKDDVAGGTSLLGLALDPLQELLAHHARRDVLVHIKAVLVGGVLAGVDGDKGHALDGAEHVGEAAALGAALVEHGDGVVIAAVGVEILECKGVDQVGMLGKPAGKVAAVQIVVDVVVAVDDGELSLLARGLEPLFGVGEHRMDVLMAGELTVLGKVAGKDHQVGLVGYDLIHGLFDDVAGLTEHLAIGMLGDCEVRAVRVQAPGEEVRIGEMSDLDLVRVIRDHGRQGGLVGVGGLGRGHSGGGYTRAGDREGHEPAARDSGAVGAVGMRHAAPSIRVHMPH